MSTIGMMYKQPRVFAHDAVLLTLTGLDITVAGTGYNSGSSGTGLLATTTTVTGVGEGLTLTVSTDGTGIIQSADILQFGSYYEDGDTVTIDNIDGTGGGSCTIIITSTGLIPNTTNIGPNNTTTGACLYIGGAGSVIVTLESGNTVKFIGLTAGSFLPVMATHVHGVTSEGSTNILALY